jgi:hypothetical protein
MRRRSFIQTITGAMACTTVAGLLPIPKPQDGYQDFLNSVGHKIHSIVLRQGKPMRHVVIEPEPSSLDATNYYRLVRVYLEGQVEPHKWFELVTY